MSTELRLKSSEFRKGREASWRDLESLIARAEKRGARSLSAEELQRLPLLYRTTLSSLSVARSVALDRNLLLYLENLALRAFLIIYAPHARQLEGIIQFLTRGLPSAVRRARWHFLIALLLQVIGGIAGYLLTTTDESWFTAIVPASLAGDRGPASTHDSLYNDEIHAPWPGFAESFAVMANFLFSHNTVVGIMIFSLGIAAGAPSVLLLIYQGLVLGAFVALHADRGLLVEILGWLSIHGVTEITAITLCGAGGLLIADKVLFPGRHARLDMVASEGREAAQIAFGAILMLFVAGILEGGFRQLVQSTELRLAIGGATGLIWLLYFTLAGRRAR